MINEKNDGKVAIASSMVQALNTTATILFIVFGIFALGIGLFGPELYSEKLIVIGSMFAFPMVLFYTMYFAIGLGRHYPELVNARLHKRKIQILTGLVFGVLLMGYMLAYYGV